MIRILLAATTVALCCNFASTAHSANITIRNGTIHYDGAIGLIDDKASELIDLEGEISRSDVTKFAQLVRVVRSRQDKNWSVRLNSPGGDVLAAMEIGEMVRKEWMWTIASRSWAGLQAADEPDMCASACVFILAAGPVRIADESSVGIHRPYFDEQMFAGLDRYQAQAKYDLLSQLVRTYLNKMGMPDQLYLEMMKTPSNKIKMLTEEETKSFSLEGVDPAYQEWRSAKRATLPVQKWNAIDLCLASHPDDMDCFKQAVLPGKFTILRVRPTVIPTPKEADRPLTNCQTYAGQHTTECPRVQLR